METQRSAAQAEASRINGAKSQGPVTAEGKAKASGNAITHGLTSDHTLLREEEIRLAEGIRCGYVRRYRPQDQLELEIVERLVMLDIKIRRLERLELKAMDRTLLAFDTDEPQDRHLPSLATLGRYRGRLNHERKLAEQRLDRLLTERPYTSEDGRPSARQLRFMADVIEAMEADAADDAASEDMCTNEPDVVEPITTEPEAVEPTMAEPGSPAPTQPVAWDMNEPEASVTPTPNPSRGFGGGGAIPNAA